MKLDSIFDLFIVIVLCFVSDLGCCGCPFCTHQCPVWNQHGVGGEEGIQCCHRAQTRLSAAAHQVVVRGEARTRLQNHKLKIHVDLNQTMDFFFFRTNWVINSKQLTCEKYFYWKDLWFCCKFYKTCLCLLLLHWLMIGLIDYVVCESRPDCLVSVPYLRRAALQRGHQTVHFWISATQARHWS